MYSFSNIITTEQFFNRILCVSLRYWSRTVVKISYASVKSYKLNEMQLPKEKLKKKVSLKIQILWVDEKIEMNWNNKVSKSRVLAP